MIKNMEAGLLAQVSRRDTTLQRQLIKAIERILYGFTSVINPLGMFEKQEKGLQIICLRLVIYKLFSCSPSIPNWFITPVNPYKMRSIAFIKQLKVAAIFYEFTSTITHRFLTNQNARRSCFIT